MAASNAASRPRKGRGAAARSGAKTVSFQGLKLEVPAKLPGALAFEIADLEAEEARFGPLIALLTTLLGEDQVAKVKAKVAEKKLDLPTVVDGLMKLIPKIIEASGTEAGK